MVSLIIYGVIAIALASAAGYAFLTFTTATKQTTYAQENTIRMESAVSAIRASLLAFSPAANGGVVFAPAGVAASDNQGHTYTQLPSSLGSVGTAPWGQPYLYCPISQTQTSGLTSDTYDTVTPGATVESPSGATYTVTTYSGQATGNIPYVIANSSTNSIANSTGYVAFIVSSLGPGLTIPDCSAISINTTTNYISVPNGSVRAISAGYPWNQRVVASTDRLEMYVSTATTGDGTGRDTNNYTTLDAALNLWQALQPRQTSIYLSSGGSFPLDSDLDAEDVRSQAQGENTSLLIGTVPGAGSLATVSMSKAVTLTTATSFINLNVTAGSSLATFKPLVFKNVAYSASTTGTAFNVIGTNFSAQNTSFGNTILSATNSTVEFYDWSSIGTSTSFLNTQFIGSTSHFSFDSDGAQPVTYSFTGTTTSNPVIMTSSAMNVSSGITMSISNANDSLYLTNSALNISGTLNLSNGTGMAGIDAIAGSSISIPNGGFVSTTSATNYGVSIRGSKLALDGTLTTSNVTAGAVGIYEGELTGTLTSAAIIVPAAKPCLYLVNAIQGPTASAGTNTKSTTNIATKAAVPVYATAASSSSAGYANYPIFTTVHLGYQPMVGDTTTSPSTLNSAVAGYLNPTNNGTNDPYVYNSEALNLVTTTGNPIGYVDPYTLEPGVRDLVNLESVTGVSLNFYGTCHS